jgi:RpiR family transcriptional regulator, carbohydrate utilization regulator
LSVLQTITNRVGSLTRMQRSIAEYILKHPEQTFKMSITELTHKTGAKSESTVVRFYRDLGFESYHDFKVTLATEIAGNSFYHTYEDITAEDNIATVKRKFFEGSAKTLHRNMYSISDVLLQQAVDLIFNCKRLIIIGFGTSGSLASDAYFKFLRLGIHCFYYPDPHYTAVMLAEPQENDVVLAISYSGESKGVVIPVKKAKPVAKVIAITGAKDSPLGNIADVCIATESEEVNYRTDAMIALIVHVAVVGTLFTGVSLRMSPASLRSLEKTKQALSYLKF